MTLMATSDLPALDVGVLIGTLKAGIATGLECWVGRGMYKRLGR